MAAAKLLVMLVFLKCMKGSLGGAALKSSRNKEDEDLKGFLARRTKGIVLYHLLTRIQMPDVSLFCDR